MPHSSASLDRQEIEPIAAAYWRDGPPRLKLSGLGAFGTRVLYARVPADEARSRLCEFVSDVAGGCPPPNAMTHGSSHGFAPLRAARTRGRCVHLARSSRFHVARRMDAARDTSQDIARQTASGRRDHHPRARLGGAVVVMLLCCCCAWGAFRRHRTVGSRASVLLFVLLPLRTLRCRTFQTPISAIMRCAVSSCARWRMPSPGGTT